MQIAIHTITTKLELNKDIEINITYDNVHVFTHSIKNRKCLTIKIQEEIEESESLSVISDSLNWFKLSILDVLSYFTNEPFILADFYKSETSIGSLDKIEKNLFFVKGKDVLPELDKMLELCVSQISRMERGVISSSLSQLISISKSLNITLSQLFDF